jgi:MoaA/NifB/PqqE/SkfB family radical SAM enzyme
MDFIGRRTGKEVSLGDHACPHPDNARIYITELCNSRCKTCNFWKNKNEVRLDTKTWQDILRQIRHLGVSSLEFVGGEPTLRNDLPDLIRTARELGFVSIKISSNGFLLNDIYIEELSRCGLNGCHISLDGLGDTYQYVRGVDWFEKVLHVIASLVKSKVQVLVLTNLTRQVVDELEALAALIHDLGSHWFVNIIENRKYGFAGVNLDKLSISATDDIARIVSILTRIKQRYPSSCLLSDSDILFIKDYLQNPQLERAVPCTLGFRDIYLDPRGNVYSACMSMKAVGNVLDMELADIVRSQKMKSNLNAMLLRRCGGCTCGYSQRAELMNQRNIL